MNVAAAGLVLFLLAKQLLPELIREKKLKRAQINELQSEIEKRTLVETRLTHLLESMNDWAWEVDQNGIYTFASPSVEKILGYKPEDIIGKTPFDLMPEDEAKRVGDIFLTIASNQQAIENLVNTNLHRGGQQVVLETSGIPFFDNDGNLAGYRGINRDITKRYVLEKQVSSERGRLKLFFDLHASLHLMVKLDGTIESLNDAWKDYLGYEKSDLLGETIQSLIHPDDLESIFAEIGKLEQGVKTFHFKNRYRNKQGEYRLLDWSAVFSDEDQMIYATANDVTEREATMEQLEKAVDNKMRELKQAMLEAEQANTAKSRFLANMSHELRTPMHAILSFANLGLKRSDEPKIVGYLKKIQSSGNRLTRLLNDLLDLSKMESGKLKLDMGEHNLTAITHSALDELSSLANKKKIAIGVKGDEVVSGMLDKSLMTQVIVNLLSNAIKFSPDNSEVSIGIQATITPLGRVAVFSITDQGPGIPAGELEDVFDSFVQSSKTNTDGGGTGLGLPISKEIIKLHHGKIWASSPPPGADIGTKFEFHVPLDSALSAEEVKPHIEKLIWNKSYSVGIPILDQQHKSIFAVINRLIDWSQMDASERDHAVLHKILKSLHDYIEYHLKYEEELMDHSQYSDYAGHSRQHESFIEKLAELSHKAADDEEQAAEQLGEFLIDWWYHHVLDEDQKYSEHLYRYLYGE